MPTLRGYRERTALDAYDCIFDAETDYLSDLSSKRAFGVENIGWYLKTNLQVSGVLASQATACVTGIRARTSLPPSRELTELAHSTVIWFVVGDRPRAQTDLASLLARPSGSERPFLDRYTSADRVGEDMAMRQYLVDEMAQEISAGRRGAHELSRYDLEIAAKVAMDNLKERPVVIVVPVRQNVSVSVDFHGRANDARRALWVKPGMIWIHLEGWISRESA